MIQAAATVQPSFYERVMPIVQKVTSAAALALKVGCVAAVIIGIMLVPIINGPNPSCTDEHCLTIREHHFPNYTAAFMNNGMQLVFEGSAGCDIHDSVANATECKGLIGYTWGEVVKQGEEKKFISDEAAAELGGVAQITIGEKTRKLNLGINPKRYENYKKAIHYVDGHFLQEKVLFQHNTSQIREEILSLHKILCRDLPKEKVLNPGSLRSKWAYVHEAGTFDIVAKAREVLLLKELKIFQKAYAKVTLNGDFSHLTKKELNLFQKLVYVAPDPKQVPQLLDAFIEKLQVDAAQGMDPLELASFAHTELVRIHPFLDGNGRVARLLMNGILSHAGQGIAIFPSDNEYTEVVAKAMHEPALFTQYLRQILKKVTVA